MFVDEKAVGEQAPAKVGILTLSEAMRIGARLRPQCVGRAFHDGASCAWGAAWEGSGGSYDEGKPYSQIAFALVDRFKAGRAFGHEISIASLNDSGRSREEIADMLEAMGY